MLELAWAIAPLMLVAAGPSHLKVAIVEATVTFGPGKPVAPDDPVPKFQPVLEALVGLQGKAPKAEAILLKFHLVNGTQRRAMDTKDASLKLGTDPVQKAFQLPWPQDLRSAEGWSLEVEVLQAKRVLARASHAVAHRYLP